MTSRRTKVTLTNERGCTSWILTQCFIIIGVLLIVNGLGADPSTGELFLVWLGANLIQADITTK